MTVDYNQVVFQKKKDNSFDINLTDGQQVLTAGNLSFDPAVKSFVQKFYISSDQMGPSEIKYDEFLDQSQKQIQDHYLKEQPKVLCDYHSKKVYQVRNLALQDEKGTEVKMTEPTNESQSKQPSKKEYSPEAKMAFRAKNLLKVRTSSPDKLEKLITQTGKLLKYSLNNQLMLMNQNHYGQYYARKEDYQQNPNFSSVDFSKIKPAQIVQPVRQDGKATTYEIVDVYSARDIGKQYLSLQSSAYSIAQRNDNDANTRYESRLTAVNNALKETYVPVPSKEQDPAKAVRSRITRYLVRRFAGIERKQFSFTPDESQLLSSMKAEDMQSMYEGCNRFAKKVVRQFENNMQLVPKIERTPAPAKAKNKAQEIIR